MRATYYDGQSARAHDVTLSIDDDRIVVTSAEGAIRSDALGAVQIMEAIGNTRRVLRFVGGASCEVTDGAAAFAALLAGHGVNDTRVAVWGRSWRIVLAVLAVMAVLAVVGYRYGLPMMAESAANRLPASALNTLSTQLQRVLDRTVFSPTRIPAARRTAIVRAFDGLQLPVGTNANLRIEFRHSDRLGANAMALPSGTIFVTDELVDLTTDDRIVLAVIAHEAGHVYRRHGLRQIIQSTATGAFVTWYIGDVSALGAAAPAALLEAKYSRDLEREADAYAAETLRLNGLPVSLLVDALAALEVVKDRGGSGGALAYLSSHPATEERIAWLKAYAK